MYTAKEEISVMHYDLYDNKDLPFACALLLIYITTVFSVYNVSGCGVENIKTCKQGIFQGWNGIVVP